MRNTLVPEIANLPKPHTWGTFIASRNPQFKTHQRASQCKNSLIGSYVKPGSYGTQQGRDCWVFRWNPDRDEWEEFAFIPQGDPNHSFWTYKESKNGRASKSVDEEAVNAALASIAMAAKSQAESRSGTTDPDGMRRLENLSLPGYQLPRLRSIARERGFKGYSKLNRSQLIELLQKEGP